jgi:hypothetical protein
MIGRTDAERVLDAFLAPEADRLPDRVLEAAFSEIARTPQRRARSVPWRFPDMPTFSRATAAIVVLVAVIGAGALYLSSNRGGAGGPGVPAATPTPSPSPTSTATATPQPTVSLDTATWVDFTSPRYGYTIGRPPGWEANPASHDWVMATDVANWLSQGQDQFIDEQATYQIGVHGFAVDIDAGMAPDQWIDAFFAGNASTCARPAAEMPPITVDGHAGKVADEQACSDEIAFVPIDRRMFVFTIGREAQYALFNAFLSTVRLPAPPATPAPS